MPFYAHMCIEEPELKLGVILHLVFWDSLSVNLEFAECPGCSRDLPVLLCPQYWG